MKILALFALVLYSFSGFAETFEIKVIDKSFCMNEEGEENKHSLLDKFFPRIFINQNMENTLLGKLTIDLVASGFYPDELGLEYDDVVKVYNECYAPVFKVKVQSCIRSKDSSLGDIYQFQLNDELEQAMAQNQIYANQMENLAIGLYLNSEGKMVRDEKKNYPLLVYEKGLQSEVNFQCNKPLHGGHQMN